MARQKKKKQKKQRISRGLAEYNRLRAEARRLGITIPAGTDLSQLRELVGCARDEDCTASVRQTRRTTVARTQGGGGVGQLCFGYSHLPATHPRRRR